MHKHKKAFTLVELIVVIVILAILGTIAFISLQGYSSDARDSSRISDISNIKTALELHSLAAGKYPLPDIYNDVYGTGTIVARHQGYIGEGVTKILSRTISEKPVDPFYNTEYIYSVTPTQFEYELMSIYESDMVNNSFIQKGEKLGLKSANAASSTVRIDGTYNGIYVKIGNYIFPTPSIITALDISSGLTLDATALESQVIDRGTNIPNIGTTRIPQSTGGLTFNNYQVFSGVINSQSNTGVFLSAYQAIANTYSNSSLASETTIQKLLSQSGDEAQIEFTKSLILNNSVGTTGSSNNGEETETPIVQGNTVLDCETKGQYLTGATTTYQGCDTEDLIVCSGAGDGYTVAACNVGATISGTDRTNINTIGKHFQWGRNDGFEYNGGATPTTTSTLYTGTDHIEGGIDLSGDATYKNKYIITTTTYNRNWLSKTGESTDSSWGQGPCSTGYHVPTQTEWNGIITSGDGYLWDIASTTTEGTDLQTVLKLPYSGRYYRQNGGYTEGGSIGYYYSSSPNNAYSYYVFIKSNYIDATTSNFRSEGYSIRCFKD